MKAILVLNYSTGGRKFVVIPMRRWFFFRTSITELRALIGFSFTLEVDQHVEITIAGLELQHLVQYRKADLILARSISHFLSKCAAGLSLIPTSEPVF